MLAVLATGTTAGTSDAGDEVGALEPPIDFRELAKRSGELDKQRPILVYCATGYRASLAASVLQQEGFADVRNLPGSFHAWKAAKLPVEK